MTRWRRTLAIFGGALACVALAGVGWVYALGPPPLGKDRALAWDAILSQETAECKCSL